MMESVTRRHFFKGVGSASLLLAAELAFGDFKTIIRYAESQNPTLEYTARIDEEQLTLAMIIGTPYREDGASYVNVTLDTVKAMECLTITDNIGNSYTFDEFQRKFDLV